MTIYLSILQDFPEVEFKEPLDMKTFKNLSIEGLKTFKNPSIEDLKTFKNLSIEGLKTLRNLSWKGAGV